MFNHPGESRRSWTASAQARVCTGELSASISAAKEEVGSLKCVPGGQWGMGMLFEHKQREYQLPLADAVLMFSGTVLSGSNYGMCVLLSPN